MELRLGILKGAPIGLGTVGRAGSFAQGAAAGLLQHGVNQRGDSLENEAQLVNSLHHVVAAIPELGNNGQDVDALLACQE